MSAAAATETVTPRDNSSDREAGAQLARTAPPLTERQVAAAAVLLTTATT